MILELETKESGLHVDPVCYCVNVIAHIFGDEQATQSCPSTHYMLLKILAWMLYYPRVSGSEELVSILESNMPINGATLRQPLISSY